MTPGSLWKSRRAFSRLIRHIVAISASVKCRSSNVSTTNEFSRAGACFVIMGHALGNLLDPDFHFGRNPRSFVRHSGYLRQKSLGRWSKTNARQRNGDRQIQSESRPKNVLYWTRMHRSILYICATRPIHFVISPMIIGWSLHVQDLAMVDCFTSNSLHCSPLQNPFPLSPDGPSTPRH